MAAAPPERAAPDLRPRLPPDPSEAVAPHTPDGAAILGRGGDALGRWVAEQAGRSRVESGLAHPYYLDVGKALAHLWDAERVVKVRGVEGYVRELGRNAREFGRTWATMAEGYGRTGQPSLIDGGSERVREVIALPPGPARDALLGAELLRQLRRAYSEGHVTTVRVVQAADGALRSVEFVEPSIDAEVDREAIEAVRGAVACLPPPPADALRERDALASIWEFELEVSITPPIPVVALEFDEVLGLGDLRAPLDRRVWKRVRLVGAD
ncbi:MAG TPA: TonB C-terminal domain-containing protein [Anaeromyxobacter sp.]